MRTIRYPENRRIMDIRRAFGTAFIFVFYFCATYLFPRTVRKACFRRCVEQWVKLCVPISIVILKLQLVVIHRELFRNVIDHRRAVQVTDEGGAGSRDVSE